MPDNTYNDILHPSDFTTGDEAAWEHALKIALAAGGRLSLLHCSDTDDQVDWSEFPHIRTTLERWKLVPPDSSREEAAKTGVRFRKVAVTGMDPVSTILDHIINHEPRLIVLATHQRQGLARWIRSAIAEPLARQARTRTLFVPRRIMGFVSPSNGEVSLKNVVIPVVTSPKPHRAVTAVTELLELLGCEEVVIHCVHAGAGGEMPFIELPQRDGWTTHCTTLEEGSPVEAILSFAEECNADLIAMTTQGHKGFLDALRGSTTERILRDTKCPVLAIPES